MNKLLCENPRSGSRSHSYKDVRHSKKNEDLPYKQGMSKPYNWSMQKELNENLNPFYRFLDSCAGRKWDSVYSEIRSNLRVDRAIDLHIMQHLWQHVEKDVYEKDGKLYINRRYSGETLLENSYCHLYIDPRDGILRKCEKKPRVKKELPLECVVTGPGQELRLYNGLWYMCKVAVPPEWETYKWFSGWKEEWVTGSRAGSAQCMLSKHSVRYPYTYVSEYRSANKKEIKKWVKTSERP
jgi:hypothetical protein